MIAVLAIYLGGLCSSLTVGLLLRWPWRLLVTAPTLWPFWTVVMLLEAGLHTVGLRVPAALDRWLDRYFAWGHALRP